MPSVETLVAEVEGAVGDPAELTRLASALRTANIPEVDRELLLGRVETYLEEPRSLQRPAGAEPPPETW